MVVITNGNSITYKHMTDPNGNKIQVDSTIRDGTGKRIDTNYQSKLVSGENIKTIGGNSVLGSGNLNIGLTITTYNNAE